MREGTTRLYQLSAEAKRHLCKFKCGQRCASTGSGYTSLDTPHSPTILAIACPRSIVGAAILLNSSHSPSIATDQLHHLTPNLTSNSPSNFFPPACPIAQPQFTWGGVDSRTFIQSVTAAYNEVVHWRRNIFAVPSWKAGKTFIREMAKLYRAYAEGTALETVALKATTILPILLLQKPHHSSKSREHSACLERRLTAWNAGDIDTLLQEGRTIQNRLPKAGPTAKDEARTTRAFSKLMLQGKTKAALPKPPLSQIIAKAGSFD